MYPHMILRVPITAVVVISAEIPALSSPSPVAKMEDGNLCLETKDMIISTRFTA